MSVVATINKYIDELNESKGLSVEHGDNIIECLNNVLAVQGLSEDTRHINLNDAVYGILSRLGSEQGGDDSPIPGPTPVGDGKTRFYISVGPAALTYYIDLALIVQDGGMTSVTIDWGDGTVIIHDDAAEISHVYSEPGDYVVTLSVDSGSIELFGSSVNYTPTIYGYDSEDDRYNFPLLYAEIGDNVEIGSGAFSGCSALTSVTIQPGVTSIGDSAFQSCTALTSVTIPGSVTSIGDSAFQGCSALTSVTIQPGRVTSIGSGAFQGCSALTSVTIQPGSVTSIGAVAFKGCSALTSVTIPGSVTSIGAVAFSGCYLMSTVNIEAETPPRLGDSSFFETYCLFYVPAGSVDAYKAAERWSEYADRIVAAV